MLTQPFFIYIIFIPVFPSDSSKEISKSNTRTDSEKNDDSCEETVEEHEQTIYKGILSTQIKLVKSFSTMALLYIILLGKKLLSKEVNLLL